MSALSPLSRERERDGVRVDGALALARPPHPSPLPHRGEGKINAREGVLIMHYAKREDVEDPSYHEGRRMGEHALPAMSLIRS
jgi:hypothetical protein